MTKELVGERFRLGSESCFDMLGSFIRHGLSQEEAAGEALLQVVAGSNTSAGTVGAVMLHVLTYPKEHQKLQAGIDESIRKGLFRLGNRFGGA